MAPAVATPYAAPGTGFRPWRFHARRARQQPAQGLKGLTTPFMTHFSGHKEPGIAGHPASLCVISDPQTFEQPREAAYSSTTGSASAENTTQTR